MNKNDSTILESLDVYLDNVTQGVHKQEKLIDSIKEYIRSNSNSYPQEVLEQRKRLPKEYEYLNDLKNKREEANASKLLYVNNKFKYQTSKTDNFLNYDNTKMSCWHWQWKILQSDVILYYGSKLKMK